MSELTTVDYIDRYQYSPWTSQTIFFIENEKTKTPYTFTGTVKQDHFLKSERNGHCRSEAPWPIPSPYDSMPDRAQSRENGQTPHKPCMFHTFFVAS